MKPGMMITLLLLLIVTAVIATEQKRDNATAVALVMCQEQQAMKATADRMPPLLAMVSKY